MNLELALKPIYRVHMCNFDKFLFSIRCEWTGVCECVFSTMEFPDLGQHCSEATCHQLDFLPLRCDACEEIFCREHIAYKNHNCKSAYKKDFQVPVCPLCNSPIPMKKGERPDIVVGAHIDNDCQKAGNQKKIFNNKCSAKGCKVKEVVPVICNECQLNFCLKHRHPVDHQCEGAAGAARRRAMEAAVARQRKSNAGPSSRRASGIESSRQAPGNARVSRAEDIQGAMTEDEALARALALSMQGANEQNLQPSVSNDQIASDLMLAQAIAASEQEATTRRPSQSKCAVS